MLDCLEHPTLLEFIGSNKYLQLAVSKAIASAYAAKFGPVTAKDLSRTAAKEGFLTLLAWAREVGCTWDHSVFLEAVKYGQTAVMQFLLDNQCPLVGYPRAFDVAARGHSLATFEWLYHHKHDWGELTCSTAAGAGWLEGLQYLRAKGCRWDRETRSKAAEKGHLDVLKFAHYNNCPGALADGSYSAAYSGQVGVLQWMFEEGCVLDTNTCFKAAENNRLETLKWLRDNNVPWDCRVLRIARAGSHSDVERWALANGCPEDW